MRTCLLLPISVFCGILCVPRASAQDAAEAAGATAMSSSAAAKAKTMEIPGVLPTAAKSTQTQMSPHILASSKTVSVEANRQALEAKAGPDAARLLVRSAPSPAQVWINNQPVGSTPLLLIVAPGKYTVEMRGPRQETGQTQLALLPKETREVAVKLELRYPTRVSVTH